MAKKLKVYQTSQGFFDLAIAAPSMKAALEAWGANSNLFHQGFAQEIADARTVKATRAKPGVVLQRPVGTHGPFREHSELPKSLELGKSSKRSQPAPKQKPSARKIDGKASKAAAATYEKELKRRDAERRKQEAADAKERSRRDHAKALAQKALAKAEAEHAERSGLLARERDLLEKREKAEEARWEDERTRLMKALRRAEN
jgi:hypothetical protein